jgi:hypothetical protein
MQTAAQSAAIQQEQENWTPLTYVNSNEPESRLAKDKLYCKNTENVIKLGVTTEQLMNLS